MKKHNFAFFLIFFVQTFAFGQVPKIGTISDDVSVFLAETKQLNQFFRRFNAEEDKKGDRYYEGDKLYRDKELRKKYISVLFDNQNTAVSQDLKVGFLNDVTDNQKFLEFLGGNWFAELETSFIWKGRKEKVTLFAELQKETVGSKWIITNAQTELFEQMFYPDTTNAKRLEFLHPLSHELYFMNLKKVFEQRKFVEYFTSRQFRPNQLTLLLYEIKNGNLTFEQVNTVKFHFLQTDNWYFEVSNFERAGYNKGWLISNLSKVQTADREKVIKYLRYEARY